MTHQAESAKRGGRGGFTLIELLVVIAIIAILAALSAWGVFAMIGGRRAHNTEANIVVLNKMLQGRMKRVIDDAKKESPSAQVLALAGGDPARARVIWIKVRMMEAFPVNYAEVIPPSPPSVVQRYIPASRQKPYFAKYQSTLAGKTGGGAGESAACLLLALKTQMQADGVNVEDQLASSIGDTDGDGVTELLDGWGKPLVFFRFPWNNPALQSANPAKPGSAGTLYADPVDPQGTLINKLWSTTSQCLGPVDPLDPSKGYEPQFHPVGQRAGAGMPPTRAWYMIPIIASAGADGVLGLNPDFSIAAPSAERDNIYSYVLRGE